MTAAVRVRCAARGVTPTDSPTFSLSSAALSVSHTSGTIDILVRECVQLSAVATPRISAAAAELAARADHSPPDDAKQASASMGARSSSGSNRGDSGGDEYIGCLVGFSLGAAGAAAAARAVSGAAGMGWAAAGANAALQLIEGPGVLGVLAKAGLAAAALKALADVAKRPTCALNVYAPSSFLGATFAVGGLVAAGSGRHWSWGGYMMSMSAFHLSEYFITAVHNHETLSADSFLLNHSNAYSIAAVASWAEYWIEFALLPSFHSDAVSRVGAGVVVAADAFRKLAMHTAGSNFKHLVADRRDERHELVTEGVYRLARHPSYVGWFYWSIGTQVLLCNPVCAVGYALAAWRFFRDRIEYEEIRLIDFFGDDYVAYQRRVGTGLPFIDGWVIPEGHHVTA